MAATTKTTKSAPTFKVADLPDSATQYRNASGGTGTQQATDYKSATRVLAKWAGRGTDNAVQVHALVHLGWCAGAGSRANCEASKSTAFVAAKGVLEVGKPAAPQVVKVLTALKTAGAPAEAIATVWATFTGQAA